MKTPTPLSFIGELLFSEWSYLATFGSIASIVPFLAGNSYLGWSFEKSSAVALIIFLIVFMFKVCKQAYTYFVYYHKPMRAISMLNGEGFYEGKIIIVLSTHTQMQNGTLLTLFCNSSGAQQPIAILHVIDSDKNQINSEVFISASDLKKYFEEHSRKNALFATPIISSTDISTGVEDDK